MSENFYFDIKGRSAMPFQVYIGGRGIGKSYSALRELATNFPADEKWIYMRRTGKEIEATDPHRVLTVTIYDSNTTDVRSVNDAPPDTVVVEQSFEIGNIHRAVLVGLYVVTTVVPAIFCHCEIADKRKSLSCCRCSKIKELKNRKG